MAAGSVKLFVSAEGVQLLTVSRSDLVVIATGVWNTPGSAGGKSEPIDEKWLIGGSVWITNKKLKRFQWSVGTLTGTNSDSFLFPFSFFLLISSSPGFNGEQPDFLLTSWPPVSSAASAPMEATCRWKKKKTFPSCDFWLAGQTLKYFCFFFLLIGNQETCCWCFIQSSVWVCRKWSECSGMKASETRLPCGHGFLTCLFSGWGVWGNIWLAKTRTCSWEAEAWGRSWRASVPVCLHSCRLDGRGPAEDSLHASLLLSFSPSFFLFLFKSSYSCVLLSCFFPSFSCFLFSFYFFHSSFIILFLPFFLSVFFSFSFPFHALWIKILRFSSLDEPNYLSKKKKQKGRINIQERILTDIHFLDKFF